MAKHLHILLGNTNPLLIGTLHEFEKATGSAGVDARLIGEIIERAHTVLRELRLDPSDTTPEELYQVLRSHHSTPELFTDTDFVGLSFDGQVISLNGGDIIINSNRSFEERSLEHFRAALEHELVHRYAAHAKTHTPTITKKAHEAGLRIKVTKDEIKMKNDSKVPLILAVGDIITDAFIKLDEHYAQVSTDKDGYKRLSFEMGAKLPYDDVDIVQAVECSPNAAVSITRLGLRVNLMSWLGDDGPGNDMIKYLKEQSVGTDELIVEKGMKSNYHYVLRYGADRTKLQKFEAYDYKWRAPAEKPDWLYLGVLGEKTWPLHQELLKYLHENPDIKLVLQPGMYHLIWGTKKMAPLYDRAEIVILNREEAAQVTGTGRESIKDLIGGLHKLGIKVAVVTDGPDGAYASEGDKILFMPNYPDPKPPLDRTGAGDAFASTIAAALALGEPLETALKWAPINSMSVVQTLGAQGGLIDRPTLEKYLNDAPKDYFASEYTGK